MKSRVVNTKFWTDAYITELDPSEKLIFIYLITNNLTNICGIYEITLRQISFDTGFELETVKRILQRFERDGKVAYKDGWVAIRNFIKNQNQGSPQVKKGIKREFELSPIYHQNYVLEGIDTLSYLTKPNLTKPNLTKPNDESTFADDSKFDKSIITQYFEGRNYPKEEAELFYNHYAGQGWVTGSGLPIVNWKLKAENWHKEQGKRNLKNHKSELKGYDAY